MTAQKIRNIARQLNYRTNEIARSLKTSKTSTIGLMIADVANPFSACLARIIEDEADRHNYTVVMGSSDENEHKSAKLINTFINRRVDGLILLLPSHAEHQLKYLRRLDIPFVLLDRYFPGSKTSYVALDNYNAALEAVKHIISTGRKKIGMITYKSDLFHLQERRRGYKTALKKAGIAFDKNRLKQVSIRNDRAEIEQAINDLLPAGSPADAILFGTNNIATCGLQYINALAIKVPHDLALVSFDQTPMLDLFYAPVTYIRQPLQEMGRMAIKVLFEKMENNKTIKEINMKAELVIRESTAGDKS